ncbi:uncharacterized protein LOC126893739 [Daktulosphaira vitifoliae]|uniref:uncharacterized protein LOC126893739 n=1 Tax=Daktulosphaira vitifoliae TaxID=58002 RepID=UPI0021A98FDD|nr:uncharacterized protein LOC126893739 [Daktulosphaira vitifoliae]
MIELSVFVQNTIRKRGFQSHIINQCARAVLKLFIMQLIDLNYYKNLLRDSCLIYIKIQNPKLVLSDCYSCESIDYVNVIENYLLALDSYRDLEWPVMFTNSYDTQTNVHNVTHNLFYNDLLPCNFESNLKIDPIKAIESKINGWFMHWRNCDDTTGRDIRSLYKLDLFLNPSIETWSIMASNYNTINYKKIDLYYDSQVIIAQISGSFKYKLVPKDPCTDTCMVLKGRLIKNDILMFNSFLWEFHYLPLNNFAESIAFIYHLE